MTKSVRKVLIGAALTGFVLGTTAAASAAPRPGDDATTTKTKIEKHCCGGKNTCKGKGGCGADKRQERLLGQGRVQHLQKQAVRARTLQGHHPNSPVGIRRGGLDAESQAGPLALAKALPSKSSMPANRFNGNSDYGVGIGLRVPHYGHIFSKKPVVSWFEIISENFMLDGGRPLAILDQILEQYRVVQHGVSMYFGSAEPLNREHLKRLKALVKRTKTPWLTDHLCWGSVDGRYTHDLLPMPYTFEAARRTGAEDSRSTRLPGSAHRGGKRQQLRGVSRFRDD